MAWACMAGYRIGSLIFIHIVTHDGSSNIKQARMLLALFNKSQTTDKIVGYTTKRAKTGRIISNGRITKPLCANFIEMCPV